MATFPKGSIVRVVYKNFLTYDNGVMTPGSNLNLIIGTNGSGKSSIICGICLAVGGSPKSLGRSERMGDYIKHGKDQASVEVVIADEEKGDRSLKIVIKKPNTCEFYLNGQKSTQKAIKDTAAYYNIQIDNPCTFLAQDKVKSFSEQNPVELLKNTEKAGATDLLEKHLRLIDRKKQEGRQKDDLKKTEQEIEHLQREQETLAPRVENYKKKRAMRSRFDALTKRRAILVHQEARKKFKNADQELDTLRNDIKESEKDLKVKKIDEENLREKYQKVTQDAAKMRRQMEGLKERLEGMSNPHFYQERVLDADNSYNNAKREYEVYETKLKELEAKCETMRNNLEKAQENMHGYDEFSAKVNEVRTKFNKQDVELTKKEEGFNARDKELGFKRMDLRRRMEKSESAMRERIHNLLQRQQDQAERAWNFYVNNQDKFEYPVYVPALHITIDQQSAKFLENIVGFRDHIMFIFGSRADEATLTKGHGWKINTTVLDRNQINPSVINAQLPQQLEQFGFRKWAIQLFDAPDEVKQYLCDVSHLHKVPIGTSRTDQMGDQVVQAMKQARISLYLTESQRCSISVSSYSGQTIQHNTQLHNPQTYLNHLTPLPKPGLFEADTKKIQEMEAQLRSDKSTISKERQEYDEKTEAFKNEFKNWMSKKKLVTTFMANLKTAEDDVDRKMRSKPDLEAAKEALDECRELAIKASLDRAKKVITISKDIYKLYHNSEMEQHRSKILQKELNEMRRSNEVCSYKLEELKESLRTKEYRVTALRDEMSLAKDDVVRLCNIKVLDDRKMNEVDKRTWEQLQKDFVTHNVPDDIDELERLIAQENAKKSITTGGGTKEDVERMNFVTGLLVNLLDKQKKQMADQETWQENMQKEIDDWKGPVEELIAAINTNYRDFFAKLGAGCSGEVHLEVPEDPLEVESYGIMIMVAFRANEPMKRLDHQVQSGGERSVSTMLYLLALQELCPVPFRCVDEINQGMDPTNERRVFDIMVKTLTGTGSLAVTQYFLLTPKLLRGLSYNEKVTIQIVHNGPSLDEEAWQWNSEDFMSTLERQTGVAAN